MFHRRPPVQLPEPPPRDLLAERIGERLHVALTTGAQLSGVVRDVTPCTRDGGGELELGMVRVVAGELTHAADGIVGVERSRIAYWQHIVTATVVG